MTTSEFIIQNTVNKRYATIEHYKVLTSQQIDAINKISNHFSDKEKIIKDDFLIFFEKVKDNKSFLEEDFFVFIGSSTMPTSITFNKNMVCENLKISIEFCQKWQKLAKILNKTIATLIPTKLDDWQQKIREASNRFHNTRHYPYGTSSQQAYLEKRKKYDEEMIELNKIKPDKNEVDIAREVIDYYKISSLQKKHLEAFLDINNLTEKIEDDETKTYQNDAYVLGIPKNNTVEYLNQYGYFGANLNEALLFPSYEKARRSASSRGVKKYLLIKINMLAKEIIESVNCDQQNLLQSIIERKSIEQMFDDFSLSDIETELKKRTLSKKSNKI